MYTTDPEQISHRAYGVTTYDNHQQRDLKFLASAKEVGFISKLRNVETAVSVGTGTTYKLLDTTNARLYARAVDGGKKALEDIGQLIMGSFYPDPNDPSRITTAW